MKPKWANNAIQKEKVEALALELGQLSAKRFREDATGPVTEQMLEEHKSKVADTYGQLYQLLDTHMPLYYVQACMPLKIRKRVRQLTDEQNKALEDLPKQFAHNLVVYLMIFSDTMAPLYLPDQVRTMYYAHHEMNMIAKNNNKLLGIRYPKSVFAKAEK